METSVMHGKAGRLLTILLFTEAEELLLFIGLAADGQNRVAAAVESLFDIALTYGVFADNGRFAFAVRGGDFFHIEMIADGVVHMAFAHGAHHAVYFNCSFDHS